MRLGTSRPTTPITHTGQPLTITDPNGVVTTLTYDDRQRLLSRQVGSEATTFSYWPTVLLKRVTLPDSSFVENTYDGAQRLIQVTDSLGNKIVYGLDAQGNRTSETSYDPTNVLARTRSRVINSLNQVWKVIGAAGTAAVTTVNGYDGNGNPTTINAPLGRNTTNQYDALNRLRQVTDPASGNTLYGYDPFDTLKSVQDPRGQITTYAYNGFGDVISQFSPVTGTTTNTYDAAGNLKTSTDARGVVTTYAYDALNRVLTAEFKLGSTVDQLITYGYDAGTNGKGRLTSASDAAHSMSWAYAYSDHAGPAFRRKRGHRSGLCRAAVEAVCGLWLSRPCRSMPLGA
jgi:YD repeat-containing protein